MARKAQLEKEKKRRALVERHWDKRVELRNKVIDLKLTEEDRTKARIALNKMKRDTHPVRLRNRCSFSGRARGFLRKFKLSRIIFREWAGNGMVPGVFKASW